MTVAQQILLYSVVAHSMGNVNERDDTAGALIQAVGGVGMLVGMVWTLVDVWSLIFGLWS